MKRMWIRCALALLPAPFAAFAMGPATGAGAPLIEMQFSRDWRNTGTLGGEGQAIACAPGQGPAFGVGVLGNGLDLTASTRGGGSDKTPAGGAVRLKAPKLGALDQLTLTLWFQPTGPNAPARLLYLGPCWDINFSDGLIGLKIRHRQQDVSFTVPRDAIPAPEGAWRFLAVTLDRRAAEARIYHAFGSEAPRAVGLWTNMPPFDTAEADLEIGNLAGIRPFRGRIDNIRVFATALPAGRIADIASADQPPRRSLKDSLAALPEAAPIFAHSDVCFTSRSRHTNSVEMFEAFGANRLVWCYTAEKPFTDAIRAAGAASFQCAINSLPGTKETEAHTLDFDGRPMVAPWMRAFSPKNPVYWACNNRPRFMEICLDRTAQALAAGADMIQFDDWALIASAEHWGGACFCPDCLAAFREDLKQHTAQAELTALGISDPAAFDYREFLQARHGITNAAAYLEKRKTLPLTPHFDAFHRRSVRAFFVRLKEKINASAGRPIPLSINANLTHPSQQQNFLTDIADFLQGETLRFPLNELALAAKTANGLGKWQLFVTQSIDVPEARAGIAAIYALGQLPLVPWDMYMGSDATKIQPRGWGTPPQYADLFRFARENPALFDGRESAATVGLVVNLDRFDKTGTLAACQRLLDAQVPFAIVPLGHAYFDAPLHQDRLAAFDLLLTLDDPAAWAEADRAALARASRTTPVLDGTRVGDSDLRPLAAFEVWGPQGIHIIPRLARDPNDNTLVCHVLNRAFPDPGLKWISFLVRQRALPDRKLAAVRWHSPGQPPAQAEFESLPGGIRIILPRLTPWGIAELSFE